MFVRPIASTSKTDVASANCALRRRVAGREQDVPHAHRVRADQIGLHADQRAVAAGVVQQRLDAPLCSSSTPSASALARAPGLRIVGHVDRHGAQIAEAPRLFDRRVEVQPRGADDFHHDRELPVGQRARQPRFLARDRRARPAGVWPSAATCGAGRAAAGAVVFTACAIWRM